jgi:hypothetical protein
MPEQKTLQRARRARREGKRPTTQAGEFVREEIHHIREGKQVYAARAGRAGLRAAARKAAATRKAA